jgi:hypothetical protein
LLERLPRGIGARGGSRDLAGHRTAHQFPSRRFNDGLDSNRSHFRKHFQSHAPKPGEIAARHVPVHVDVLIAEKPENVDKLSGGHPNSRVLGALPRRRAGPHPGLRRHIAALRGGPRRRSGSFRGTLKVAKLIRRCHAQLFSRWARYTLFLRGDSRRLLRHCEDCLSVGGGNSQLPIRNDHAEAVQGRRLSRIDHKQANARDPRDGQGV